MKQSPGSVLKNFAKFTGKHKCRSVFFNKVAGLVSCEFFQILRTSLQNTCGGFLTEQCPFHVLLNWIFVFDILTYFIFRLFAEREHFHTSSKISARFKANIWKMFENICIFVSLVNLLFVKFHHANKMLTTEQHKP